MNEQQKLNFEPAVGWGKKASFGTKTFKYLETNQNCYFTLKL